MSRRDAPRWGPRHAELLRRGDPAAGTPDAGKRPALRARILAAAGANRRSSPRLAWLPLAGLAAAAFVAALLLVRPGTHPESAGPRAGVEPAAAPAPKPSRQLLFATPGGTRIVWVLQDQDPF